MKKNNLKIVFTYLLIFYLINLSYLYSQKREFVINKASYYGVEFSPDSKWFLTNSNEINIWDIPSLKLIRKIKDTLDFRSHINAYFTSDNKYILTYRSNSNKIKLLETETGNIVRILNGHKNNITAIATSPEGMYAVSSSDSSGYSTLKTWDLNSGKCLDTYLTHMYVENICFIEKGKFITISNPPLLWNFANMKIEFKFSNLNRDSRFYRLGNGKYAFKKTNYDNLIYICDSNTRDENKFEKFYKINLSNSLFHGNISFSPDNIHFALADANGYFYIYKRAENKPIYEIRAAAKYDLDDYTGGVQLIKYSPDGKYIISQADKITALWNTQNYKYINQINSINVYGIAKSDISYDNRNINITLLVPIKSKYILQHEHCLKFLDLDKGILKDVSCEYYANISKDNRYIFVKYHEFEGEGEIVDAESNIAIKKISDDGIILKDNKKNRSERTIWEKYKEKIKIFNGDLLYTYSKDAEYLLKSEGKELKLIRMRGNKTIKKYQGQNLDINYKCFSNTDKYVAAVSEQQNDSIDRSNFYLKVWDKESGRLINEYKYEANKFKYRNFSFSRDDKKILIYNEKEIKIYDIESGDLDKTIKYKKDEITSAEILANKRSIMVSSNDGTINFCDIKTEEIIATLYILDQTEWIVLQPSGNYEASEGANKYCHFVEGMKIIEINKNDNKYKSKLLETIINH